MQSKHPLVDAMAGLLVANPEMAATIEHDHVDDGSGHCVMLVRVARGSGGPWTGGAVVVLASGAIEAATGETSAG